MCSPVLEAPRKKFGMIFLVCDGCDLKGRRMETVYKMDGRKWPRGVCCPVTASYQSRRLDGSVRRLGQPEPSKWGWRVNSCPQDLGDVCNSRNYEECDNSIRGGSRRDCRQLSKYVRA